MGIAEVPDEHVPGSRALRISLWWDEPDRSRTPVGRFTLPWPLVRTGLYLRGSMPARIWLDLDREAHLFGIRVAVMFETRGRAAVYRETADGLPSVTGQLMWIDQVVVVMRLPAGSAG